MLVLSRKAGQELIIGDNIRITVNRVAGNRVTLGIHAPDDVRVMRGELEPVVRSFEAEIVLPVEGLPAEALGDVVTIDPLAASAASVEGRRNADELRCAAETPALVRLSWLMESNDPITDLGRQLH
jgi:carbon storage regulator CsrA